MKIFICGSMTASKRMVELERDLSGFGHDIVLPEFTHEYAKLSNQEEMHEASSRNKHKFDLMRKNNGHVLWADALLIANEGKRNEIPFYIGGNTFGEMYLAYDYGKIIYVMWQVPNMLYTDEIRAMKTVELNGDLSCFRRANIISTTKPIERRRCSDLQVRGLFSVHPQGGL
jgi:hypothetical protein